MRTIKTAAAALCAASSVDALAAIARDIGVTDEPMPLDRTSRAKLGLPAALQSVRVASGCGQLRALLAEYASGTNLRELIATTAARLSARTPHVLWMLLFTERSGSRVGIAVWSASGRSPRVSALIADRNRVLDSDADTLCALVAACSTNDLATHVRWLEVLGRDSLTRRFYGTLREVVRDLGAKAIGPGDSEEHQEVALLHVSRLLFLSFLEAKGWLDGDRAFLIRTFEESCASSGTYHHSVLRPLFFGTLNTRVSARATVARRFGRIPFLNGGLFTPTALERRLRGLRFGNEQMGRLFSDLLGRYRFTAREDSTSWSEAAIDPEMLGKAFESLMAAQTRKDSGAFYTPQALVERVTRSAIVAALAGGDLEREALDVYSEEAVCPARLKETLAKRLGRLTILDPACGSGAFLVHALSELTRLRCLAGDQRPVAQVRREVLSSSIFGVDLNPTAVWLCELRLWLAVVIESEETDPLCVPPLPNLDHHIRVGDSLLGGDFTSAPTTREARPLMQLRLRYARSTGNRKRALSRRLEKLERNFARSAIEKATAIISERRRDLLIAQRTADLFGERRGPDRAAAAAMRELKLRARELRTARRNLDDCGALPFSFTAHFPDVAAAGGFGMVVGNPPWVRLHRIPLRDRELFRREFHSFRNAAWREGAEGAAAGSGFASQVDLAALFVERGVSLLREQGALAFLLPSKLWRSLAGGGIRQLISERCRLLAIEDWTDAPPSFDAAVYPSLLLAQKHADSASRPSEVSVVVHSRTCSESWRVPTCELGVRTHSASPWLLLPPDPRRAFRALVACGNALRDTPLGRPTLGVKCGVNDAFVVTVTGISGSVARIVSREKSGEVELSLLRPALRGSALRSWRVDAGDEFVIWTHDVLGKPLEKLPPLAARWFNGWRAELTARTDARRTQRWWSLFRTEAAAHDRPRVAWSDFGKTPRAVVLGRGDRTVPLNSCYVIRCDTESDAYALCALLASPVAAAWLNAIAEPARGGFHRYLAWTIALFPIPRNWLEARALLEPFGKAAANGAIPDPDELTRAVQRAYSDSADVSALVEWMKR